MPLARREFLARLALTAGATAIACQTAEPNTELSHSTGGASSSPNDPWNDLRNQFPLSPDYVHMSALLIASHPTPVREAIERYRREIDENPVLTLQRTNRSRRSDVLSAAGRYLGVSADEIALTDSTTMGIGLIYNGLRLRPGDEVLTTDQDYYVTHEAVRQAAERNRAGSRQIPLYDDIADVSEEQLVERIRGELRPNTRVIALTWVHSSTGLKLPLRQFGEMIGEVNAERPDADRAFLCIDGVHGLGVEDIELKNLGIDFFSAGCHKWLFGPRGTGILWGSVRAWAASRPLIPSFTDDGAWEAWLSGDEPDGPTTASRMTPGGFKPFEHQWALNEAFELHQRLGKGAVQRRTHELARQLKEGLRELPHVELVTPMSEALSSGIVCFDVNGMSPSDVVKRLRDSDGVIASVTPYAVRHARLTPSIRNTPDEVDRVLAAIRKLG